MGFFVLDGKCSQDFGVNLSGTSSWGTPEREIETASIPGRSGALITYAGAWKNVVVKYPAWIARRFDCEFDAFAEWWNAHTDKYYMLEDSYHPEYFRLARPISKIDPEVGTLNRSGRFDLEFSCKPQKYLKDGNIKRTILDSSFITLKNPTDYDAYPLIISHQTEDVDNWIRAYDALDSQIFGIKFYREDDDTGVDFINCDITFDAETHESWATIGVNELSANSVIVESYANPDQYKEIILPARQSVTIESFDGAFDIYPRWYRI